MTTLELELIAEIERLQTKIIEYQKAETSLHNIIKTERENYKKELEILEREYKELANKYEEQGKELEAIAKSVENNSDKDLQILKNKLTELDFSLKKELTNLEKEF
ncbi:hypothetical protein SBK71_08850 (plasmid) [Campylobacter coli]